jgi:hypothetical protein
MSSLEQSHQSKSQTIQNLCEFEQYNEQWHYSQKWDLPRERERKQVKRDRGQIERDVSPDGVSKRGIFPNGLFWRKAGVLVSFKSKGGTAIVTPLYSAAIKILNARKFPGSVYNV